MRIAICDDEKLFAISLEKALVELGHDSSLVKSYSSGEELLTAIRKNTHSFDLIFLDIEMARMNGIQTAKEIRCENESVSIVLVTNYTSYWQEGYKINALQYLLKPVTQGELRELLEKVERQLSKERDNCLFIRSKGIEVRICLHDIKYFDIYKERISVFTTSSEIYEFYCLISLLERELEPKGFFRIHKSILMNLDYFYKRKEYDLYLTDGTMLPISRNRVSAFKEALMKRHGGDIVF